MQTITIAGRVGQDAETKDVSGNVVTNFSVAVDQGFGDRKQTNWFRCGLWGKRGEKLRSHLLKGTSVTVSGQLRIGEYNGKPQFDVDVNEVALQGGKPTGGNQSEPQREPEMAGAFEKDLDDDVPF